MEFFTCNLRGHATGKIRAEQVSITPQVSGRIVELNIKDNQLVNAGDLLLTIDKTPFQIAELNAQAQLAKAQSDLAKANNEANRRRHLSQNFYFCRRTRYR